MPLVSIRLPKELVNDVTDIIEKITEDVPGAAATYSSVARHALIDYVMRNHPTKRTAVSIELPLRRLHALSEEELEKLMHALSTVKVIGHAKGIDIAMDKIQELLVKKYY
mgnify:FL=1